MRLTEQEIKDLNKKAKYNEGIFIQPNHIPVDVKGLVIYKRVHVGGYTGGNCWNDTEPYYVHYDETDEDIDSFDILFTVLEKIVPNITLLNFKKVEKLIHSDVETEREYYGNTNDYRVKYVILEELYKLLEKLS